MSDDDNVKKPRRATGKEPDTVIPPEPVDTDTDTDGGDTGEDTAGGPEVMTTESKLSDTDAEPTDAGAYHGDAGADFGTQVVGQITRNQQIFGELVVHYPERDVRIVLDGLAASRVIAVHAGVSTRLDMQDKFTPYLAEMANMWASIDLDRVLAMSWIPGLASVGGRKMTVDPKPPAVLQP